MQQNRMSAPFFQWICMWINHITEISKIIAHLWIKRIKRRKWNRGCNGLHQLGQSIVPSILQR